MATAENANSLGLGLLPDAYRWVTAKVAHGFVDTRDGHTLALFDSVRARGMRVVPFVWAQSDDPAREAEFHATLAAHVGADGLIVNAEDAYEGAGRGKSAVYVRRLRELRPDLPLAVSVLGGAAIPPGETLTPWERPFDVDPWLEAGADFMPQAYWNMRHPNLPPPGDARHDYRPANCVRCWENAGVPRDRIRLTYGLWEVPSPVMAAQYVADTPAGCAGFSSYLYEQYPVEAAYERLLQVPHA